MAQKMTYPELVISIGPGFHPDTRGADYATLPDGLEPGDVDRIVAGAWDVYRARPMSETDPYARAMRALLDAGLL